VYGVTLTSIFENTLKAVSHRCMEHLIHVSTGHFIRGVGPTSSWNICKKVKAADASNMDSDGDNVHSNDDGNGDDNNALEFDAGNAVGKALALVTQVSETPASICLYCSNTVLADLNVPTGMRLLLTEV
jgi:hypothetical protein